MDKNCFIKIPAPFKPMGDFKAINISQVSFERLDNDETRTNILNISNLGVNVSTHTTVLGYSETGQENTLAGLKGFKITGYDKENLKIQLDSVEGLEVGFVYSIKISTCIHDVGAITAIDTNTNTITVNRICYDNVDLGAETYIFIDKRPELGTHDLGVGSVAVGISTKALYGGLAEGRISRAYGEVSHAEGFNTLALGDYAHSEGKDTKSLAKGSHSEGLTTTALSQGAHAEGTDTVAGLRAFGIASVDRSKNSITLQEIGNVVAEMEKLAIGDIYSVRFITQAYNYGKITQIDIPNRTLYVDKLYDAALRSDTNNTVFFFAKPDAGTVDIGGFSHAEGYSSKAFYQSHAEGYATEAYGRFSHTEGSGTSAGYCSHAEGQGTQAPGEYAHTEGFNSISRGNYSHSEGTATNAVGVASHAEGGSSTIYNGELDISLIKTNWLAAKNFTISAASYTHAEGNNTAALGYAAHSEGVTALAEGQASHAEGTNTTASGKNSHAEGLSTVGSGTNSHAEGEGSIAEGQASHSEGLGSQAKGIACHAEGNKTVAEAAYSHAEGGETQATGNRSHAEGYKTKSTYEATHAEGCGTTASGGYAHAEGHNTVASGAEGAHAEGNAGKATGESSHAEGYGGTAEGAHSHVEGTGCKTTAARGHAEGWSTTVSGDSGHAEGKKTQVTNINGHAEGENSVASGSAAHAEGFGTAASGPYSHAENQGSKSIGARSHAQGWGSEASGDSSHAEGYYTKATGSYQHVQGRFNAPNANMAHIIGGGTSDTARKNIHTVDWNGNAYFAGGLTADGEISATSFTGSLNKARGSISGGMTIIESELVFAPGAGGSGESWYEDVEKGTISDLVSTVNTLNDKVQNALSGDLYSFKTVTDSTSIPAKSMNYASIDILGGRWSATRKQSEVSFVLKTMDEVYTNAIGEETFRMKSSFNENTKESSLQITPSSFTGKLSDTVLKLYYLQGEGDVIELKLGYRTFDKVNESYVYNTNGDGNYLYDQLSEQYVKINTTYIAKEGQTLAYAGIFNEDDNCTYQFALELAEAFGGGSFDFYYDAGTAISLCYSNNPVVFANDTNKTFLRLGKKLKDSSYFYPDLSQLKTIVKSDYCIYLQPELGYALEDDMVLPQLMFGIFNERTSGDISDYMFVDYEELRRANSQGTYTYKYGELAPNWGMVSYDFPLDGHFNFSDNMENSYTFYLNTSANYSGALFIDGSYLTEAASYSTEVTVMKSTTTADDVSHISFAAYNLTGFIGKAIPQLHPITIKCNYTATYWDYSPLIVNSISVGTQSTSHVEEIVPVKETTDWGLTVDGGFFVINGTLEAGIYRIPIQTFSLVDTLYAYTVSVRSGSVSNAYTEVSLGGLGISMNAASLKMPTSNYSRSDRVVPSELGLVGKQITYLNLFVGQTATFDNLRFQVMLNYTRTTFTEARKYEIPEEVQKLDGYGLGGISDIDGNDVDNYINFESLTFVKKCRLERNTIVELTEPEIVDVSAYFTDGTIDISDANRIVFNSSDGEAYIRSVITYQVRNY